MRKTTILAIALIGVMVAGLYHLKQRVQGLEGRLASVNAAITRDRQAIHVLRAEWAYLIRPTRLTRLSRRHLKLSRVRPDQIRAFDELPERFAKPRKLGGPAKAGVSR